MNRGPYSWAMAAGAFAAANVALVALAALGLLVPVVGAVIVVIAVGAVLQRPQRGVLLLALLAPFQGLLLIAPLPPVLSYWTEALVVVTAGASFLASTRTAEPRRLPQWMPAIVALVALGVGSAIVVGGVQAIVGLKIAFFYVLVGVAVWRCPLSRADRDRLVTILMGTGIVAAVYGLIQQVLGPFRLNELGYEWNENIRYAGSFLRSFSSFNQPFGFGLYLMVVVLVCLPIALGDLRRVRNQVFLLALPVLALGMLSSFVRAAWLGTAVGLLYLGASRHRSLLLLIPVAVVTTTLLPPDVAASALSSSSSEQRVTHWQQQIDSVLANPMGAGIGASGSAAERAAELTGGELTYQPDNYYLKLLLELGPLGLWLFALLLASAFATTRLLARRHGGFDGALARGVSASVLAAAFSSLFATYFEVFPLDLLFWLLLATVSAAHPSAAHERDERVPGLRASTRAALV